MPDAADQLIAEIEASAAWPLARERDIINTVRRRRAFRRADPLRHAYDRQLILDLANWEQRAQQLFVGGEAREYVIDPLPKRIASAFADFLWGAEPDFDASTEADQPWLDLIVSENKLPSRLLTQERVKVSEGETWWKIWTDRDCAMTPLLDFFSRLCVVPFWRGDTLLAVAFHTDVAVEPVERADWSEMYGEYTGTTVYRHLEVHVDQRVVNLLYKGTRSELGKRLELGTRPETADLQDEWHHGLPMLAGRLVNEIDGDPALGVSDYDQVVDLFLALNEARTIGSENTRLTARKRLFVHGSLTSPDGTFDGGGDVIAVESDGSMLGETGGVPPVKEVEYSYDAEPLIAHMSEVEGTILSRVGLVPQLVGRGIEGNSPSGTSIRLRFLPTENAASAKAKESDDRLPLILQLQMMVDALPVERGGFGRSYSGLLAPPTIIRGSILPRDDGEVVKENAVAVGAGIRSRRTAIKSQNPEWTDAEVDDEIDEIDKDEEQATPAAPPPPGGVFPPPQALSQGA